MPYYPDPGSAHNSEPPLSGLENGLGLSHWLDPQIESKSVSTKDTGSFLDAREDKDQRWGEEQHLVLVTWVHPSATHLIRPAWLLAAWA